MEIPCLEWVEASQGTSFEFYCSLSLHQLETYHTNSNAYVDCAHQDVEEPSIHFCFVLSRSQLNESSKPKCFVTAIGESVPENVRFCLFGSFCLTKRSFDALFMSACSCFLKSSSAAKFFDVSGSNWQCQLFNPMKTEVHCASGQHIRTFYSNVGPWHQTSKVNARWMVANIPCWLMVVNCRTQRPWKHQLILSTWPAASTGKLAKATVC